MKTIYECPQSKGVRVSTVLAFLFLLVVLLLEIYFFTEMGRSLEAVIEYVHISILLRLSIISTMTCLLVECSVSC